MSTTSIEQLIKFSKKAKKIRNLVCLLNLRATQAIEIQIYKYVYHRVDLKLRALLLRNLLSNRRFYSALRSIYAPQHSCNYSAKLIHCTDSRIHVCCVLLSIEVSLRKEKKNRTCSRAWRFSWRNFLIFTKQTRAYLSWDLRYRLL